MVDPSDIYKLVETVKISRFHRLRVKWQQNEPEDLFFVVSSTAVERYVT